MASTTFLFLFFFVRVPYRLQTAIFYGKRNYEIADGKNYEIVISSERKEDLLYNN